LEVYLGSYPWPVFNLADSAISLGIALLVLDMWLKRKTGKPSKES
jgi:signal peptidase II